MGAPSHNSLLGGYDVAPSQAINATPNSAVTGCPIPHDAIFLALPDAQLCSLFRVSLRTVWQWRRDVSQSSSPLFRSTVSTFTGRGDKDSGANTITLLPPLSTSPRPLQTAADRLDRRSSSCLVGPLSCSTLKDVAPHVPPSAGVKPVAAATEEPSATPISTQRKAVSALPTGLPTLDAAFLGGLRRGWVTELTGLPNSGKTTVAAAWSRHVLHSAVGWECVWLQSSPTLHPAVTSIAEDDEEEKKSVSPFKHVAQDGFLRNAVHVASLSDLDALQDLLQLWLSDRSSLQAVGLVVLDSITELVRNTFGDREYDALQRHDALARALQTLKRIAEDSQVAVLVLSQQHQLPSPPFCNDLNSGMRAEPNDDDVSDIFLSDCCNRGVRTAKEESRATAATKCAGGDPLRSPEVGELGRLFFHNVNVRLRVRVVYPAAATSSPAPIFNPATMVLSSQPLCPQWKLEVLKCPLCASLAIALQLRVSQRFAAVTGVPEVPATQKHAVVDTTCTCVLFVEEMPEQHTLEPLSGTAEVGGELLCASIDPWDYTEIPSFVYL